MRENRAVEILSVAEMYAADRAATDSGVSSLMLMEAAGQAIVREITRAWSPRRVAILCGPGNNGGDGFVVARLLFDRGWPVTVGLLGPVEALRGDAAANAAQWQSMGGRVQRLGLAILDRADLVVDALFGAGLNRALEGIARDVVEVIGRMALPVCAVDIPSGVNGDTGATAGIAPQADVTVTFARPKPGHYLYPGRGLCGRLVVADIGLNDAVIGAVAGKTWLNSPALWQWPRPSARSHKHSRGHVVVFGGRDMAGAARLAAAGARRAGAGLLTLAVPAAITALCAADVPGMFVEAVDQSDDFDRVLKDPRRNAVVIGPGFGVGPVTADRVLRVLETDKAVVVDADALTSFAAKPEVFFSACRGRRAATVLTPHEGEFQRLFPAPGGKLARARAAAADSGATVILKGPDTVVAASDGRAAITPASSHWLATGGSGDVLAGFVAGLSAQGMAAFEAAAAAAWAHARSGDICGPGLVAEDLPEALPEVLNSLI